MLTSFALVDGTLTPGGIIAWIVVGLIAGFLAGQVVKGSGFGILGDIIVGIVGAFIGGILASLLIPDANFGFWGSIVVAFIGAVVLLLILRAFSGNRSRV